jgi:hypothetical protein
MMTLAFDPDQTTSNAESPSDVTESTAEMSAQLLRALTRQAPPGYTVASNDDKLRRPNGALRMSFELSSPRTDRSIIYAVSDAALVWMAFYDGDQSVHSDGYPLTREAVADAVRDGLYFLQNLTRSPATKHEYMVCRKALVLGNAKRIEKLRDRLSSVGIRVADVWERLAGRAKAIPNNINLLLITEYVSHGQAGAIADAAKAKGIPVLFVVANRWPATLDKLIQANIVPEWLAGGNEPRAAELVPSPRREVVLSDEQIQVEAERVLITGGAHLTKSALQEQTYANLRTLYPTWKAPPDAAFTPLLNNARRACGIELTYDPARPLTRMVKIDREQFNKAAKRHGCVHVVLPAAGPLTFPGYTDTIIAYEEAPMLAQPVNGHRPPAPAPAPALAPPTKLPEPSAQEFRDAIHAIITRYLLTTYPLAEHDDMAAHAEPLLRAQFPNWTGKKLKVPSDTMAKARRDVGMSTRAKPGYKRWVTLDATIFYARAKSLGVEPVDLTQPFKQPQKWVGGLPAVGQALVAASQPAAQPVAPTVEAQPVEATLPAAGSGIPDEVREAAALLRETLAKHNMTLTSPLKFVRKVVVVVDEAGEL